MANEEILEIVKLKYKDAKISENKIILGEIFYTKKLDTKTGFISNVEGYSALLNAKTNILCSIYIEDNKIKFFGYNENGSVYNCNLEFEFKNIIELKHILGLEITRKDIINYLEKEFGERYSITDVIVGWELNIKNELCDDFIIEIDGYTNSLILKGFTDVEDGYTIRTSKIFSASNSNEYWRFYSIINNLVG